MKKSGIIVGLVLFVAIATAAMVKWRGTRMTHTEIEAMTALARIYCNEGDYDRAIELYSKIMKRTKNSPFTRIWLAAAFFEKGDFREAEKHYRILLETDKDSPIVLYNLAQTLYRQGRVKEAGRYFTRFLEDYGDLLPGLAEKACELVDQGVGL